MKVLLIKLSSIGDLIHVFPALTDLQKVCPEVEVTWVVESAFTEIPLWHPAVKRVIAAPLRQIKKEGFGLKAFKALVHLMKELRQEKYDYVIDAQGLFKSVWMAKVAKGQSIGFGRGSAREAVWWLYNKRVHASWDWHAIRRIQALFQVMTQQRSEKIDYALRPWQPTKTKVLLFAHGTTWISKHYPDNLWAELVKLATKAGYQIWLPYSNDKELKRAQFLQQQGAVTILPKMSLTALKEKLYEVAGVISVDTGLAHIAAAIGAPTVTLYGPTEPSKIGTIGPRQAHLTTALTCAPSDKKACAHPEHDKKSAFACFEVISPQTILTRLKQVMQE